MDVEWPKGSTRLYRRSGKVVYRRKMQADYGYVPGTKDADDEELDVYVGPHASKRVFVIDQRKKDGSFDEHKVMLRYRNAKAAQQAFLQHVPSINSMGGIREMTMEDFKQKFLPDAEARKAFDESVSIIEKAQGLSSYIFMIRSDLEGFTPAESGFNEWLLTHDPDKHKDRVAAYMARKTGIAK